MMSIKYFEKILFTIHHINVHLVHYIILNFKSTINHYFRKIILNKEFKNLKHILHNIFRCKIIFHLRLKYNSVKVFEFLEK